MTQQFLCYIGDNTTTRDAIVDALKGQDDYRLISTAHTRKILDGKPGHHIDIALVACPAHEEGLAQTVAHVNTRLPEARIVLLAQEVTPAIIAQSLAEGTMGCLGCRRNMALLPAYLDLVKNGVAVFPAMLADIMIQHQNWFKELVHPPPDYDLSPRELEVLALLTDGCPNKIIARELDITEATVKVHLRAILNKIGVKNRTQAALRAIQHGLVTNTTTEYSTESGH